MIDALANTPERAEIRDAMRTICNRFDDDYWAEKDRTHSFPSEFAKAMAEGGWLGIAMPQEFGEILAPLPDRDEVEHGSGRGRGARGPVRVLGT